MMPKPFTEKTCPKCGQVIRIRYNSNSNYFVEHVRYCQADKITWQNPR